VLVAPSRPAGSCIIRRRESIGAIGGGSRLCRVTAAVGCLAGFGGATRAQGSLRPNNGFERTPQLESRANNLASWASSGSVRPSSFASGAVQASPVRQHRSRPRGRVPPWTGSCESHWMPTGPRSRLPEGFPGRCSSVDLLPAVGSVRPVDTPRVRLQLGRAPGCGSPVEIWRRCRIDIAVSPRSLLAVCELPSANDETRRSRCSAERGLWRASSASTGEADWRIHRSIRCVPGGHGVRKPDSTVAEVPAEPLATASARAHGLSLGSRLRGSASLACSHGRTALALGGLLWWNWASRRAPGAEPVLEPSTAACWRTMASNGHHSAQYEQAVSWFGHPLGGCARAGRPWRRSSQSR